MAAVATGKREKAAIRASRLYLILSSPRQGRAKVPCLLHPIHPRPRTAGKEAKAGDPIRARIRAAQDQDRGGGVRLRAEQVSLEVTTSCFGLWWT